MPAFDFSSWYALFFIAFVIVNTYIFMSLFLAVVYNNYKKHLKVWFGGGVVITLLLLGASSWFKNNVCMQETVFSWL